MSQATLANGRYNIINVEYSKSAVDLNRGDAYSPITGYASHGRAIAQRWNVHNIDKINRILIENADTGGSFASVNFQVEGSPLTGHPNATVWVAETVSKGVYRIKTSDGKYAWSLISGDKYARIVIKPASAVTNSTNAQWKFNSV